jgi:hypothetical protein
MHSHWSWVSDAVSVGVELILGEATPMKTLTAFTFFNIATVYSMRRSEAPRQLITLWALETASVVLWTVSTIVLSSAGMR